MDRELLSAIGELIDEKLTPIHHELADLRQDMTEVRQDIVGLKQEVAGLKLEVAEVKQEVVKTNIRIEHEVIPRLNALADGYDLNREETVALKKRVEAIEERVS